jgi:hypothetical protein
MSSQSEFSQLFRALKAPAAARAFPGLSDRAREESLSPDVPSAFSPRPANHAICTGLAIVWPLGTANLSSAAAG